ncbi:hypothetical protein [Mesorhizobium sp. 1B3]|uniref:hypothetical protein n=1 Tax=Mesorhizobium sp. 1B3 TaxID=3243599 RepID=UPI003D9A044E
MVRSLIGLTGVLVSIDIRAVKWRLWHGRVDQAIRNLERLVAKLKTWQQKGHFRSRLHNLCTQLLTYIRSSRGAIISYSKGNRAGLRVFTTPAESAVNSLVAKRMVKKQQMRQSQHCATC